MDKFHKSKINRTSSISSTSCPVEGTSSAHAVIATAASTGPVVRAGSLHAHAFARRLVMSAHFSTAALEDLNVPTRPQKDVRATLPVLIQTQARYN